MDDGAVAVGAASASPVEAVSAFLVEADGVDPEAILEVVIPEAVAEAAIGLARKASSPRNIRST